MDAETIGSDAYLGDDGAFAEDWMANLPEDTFEKDDTGKLKTGDIKDHKNIGSIVKSYLQKDKLLGTAIQPLPEDATEEQIKSFRSKMGCPESPEGYEITKPELPEDMVYDEDLIKAGASYAHTNHVPKTVFEGLVKLFLDGQIKRHKENGAAELAAQDKLADAATNKLKGKWGADYDKFVELGRRAYELFGKKDFVDLMASTGLKDNPVVVETFVEIYKQTHPGEFVTGDASGGTKATVPGQLVYDKSDM